MKIALVTTEFSPFRGGGIGTYCESICRALVEHGHEVHVITSVPGPNKLYGAKIHRCKIPHHTPGAMLPGKYKNWSMSLDDPNYSASYIWAKEISKIVNRYDIDIIECQECMAPIFYYLYRRMLGLESRYIPVVIHLHTPSYEVALWDRRPLESPNQHMMKFMEDFSICIADAVLSPSRFLASYVADRLPDIQNRLTVIPYPSFEKNADIHMEASVHQASEIVYVGRLEHRKGIEILVNALQELMERNENLQIRFIGKSMFSHVWGMEYREWIEHKLEKFSPRVLFDGVLGRYELMKKMHGSLCVVIPSLGENFPNVCMEAMLSGSVIVASDSGGMVEMLGDKANGFIFTSSDVGSLVTEIEKTIVLPKDKRLMIQRAVKARIEEYCNIEEIVKQRETHYQAVIARSQTDSKSGIPPNEIFGATNRHTWPDKKASSVAAIIMNDTSKSLVETISSLEISEVRPDEILVVNTHRNRHGPAYNYESKINIRDIDIYEMDHSKIRNISASAIRSDAFFYIDAGDIVSKQFIKKSLELFNEFPMLAYIQPWIKSGKYTSNPVMPFFPLFLYDHCSVSSVGMIRKSAFEESGGYEQGMHYHYRDWVFVITLMEKGWLNVSVPEISIESEKANFKKKADLEVGICNIQYDELNRKKANLFNKYVHQVLVAQGSYNYLLMRTRLSKFEWILLKFYREVRSMGENIIRQFIK